MLIHQVWISKARDYQEISATIDLFEVLFVGYNAQKPLVQSVWWNTEVISHPVVLSLEHCLIQLMHIMFMYCVYSCLHGDLMLRELCV